MKDVDCYPDKFDLENFNLTSLTSDAALTLDNSLTKRKTEIDYTPINKLAEFLKEVSRELRTARPSSVNGDLVRFFEDIYPSNETLITSAARKHSKEIIDLSEELVMAHKLSKERIKPLRDICIKLSKTALNYYEKYYSF